MPLTLKNFNNKKLLSFTAEEANCRIQLNKNGTPAVVELETSTDGTNWTDYTIGDTITLNNIGDKVYWRNKSETDTRFSLATTDFYNFKIFGSISVSGDVNYLLNKNSTKIVSDWCFSQLFATYSILSAPRLPATTLAEGCYYGMFRGCTSLVTVPKLPATVLAQHCYHDMFQNCTKIKLSTTQTGQYQTPYRIPKEGTGTTDYSALTNMFNGTGGTFTGTPDINTTYYTSNTLV